MRDKADSNGGHVITIFNSIPPYAYEVNNILALPNGFTYRFRFRRRWMPTIEAPHELVGHRGLVVLRNFDTAECTPLRRIRILDILEVGEIYYIEYILESIIDLDSHEEIRSEQLRRFNEHLKASINGFENIPGRNLKNLIFMSSDLAYGIRDEHFKGNEQNRHFNSWGNLIQVLGQMECFTDFDFFKVVQIVDNKGQSAPIVSHPYPNTARFHLKDDAVYRALVFQRRFTHRRGEGDSSVLTDRQIVLRGEPGEVRIIRSTYSIAGKYDLYQFSFKTDATSRTRDTSLPLEIHRKDAALPNIAIPIKISVGRTQKLIWITSFACFVIGITLLLGADQIRNFTSVQTDFLERIGILVTIVSSHGVVSTAELLGNILHSRVKS